MVRTSQATVFSIDLALHRMLGKAYATPINTTLNEKFTILQSEPIPEGAYPELKYFVIGVGGNNVIEGNGKYNFSEHSPLDGALFKHVPFIMKPVSQDLTAEEAADYRLRVVETISGVQYACYYAKVMPAAELKNFFYSIRTINGGTSVSAPTLSVLDTNNSEILNPTPRVRELTYNNNTTTEYITKIAKVVFKLNQEEITALENVFKLKNITGSQITEIGICSGIDKTLSTQKKEVYACQIMYHVGVNLSLALDLSSGEIINKTIEIGGSEPLLK